MMSEENNSRHGTAKEASIQKKRQLLNGPNSFNELVQKLMAIAPDVAKLELTDNDEASKRVRRNLIAFKNEDCVAFLDRIKEIRSEISAIPSKPGKRASNTMDKALSVRQEILSTNKQTKNED